MKIVINYLRFFIYSLKDFRWINIDKNNYLLLNNSIIINIK